MTLQLLYGLDLAAGDEYEFTIRIRDVLGNESSVSVMLDCPEQAL